MSFFGNGINNLQAIKTINSPDRNSCVDIFRAMAIISVVLFHFEKLLPYGHLGVDLFFVISGLLVGGLLTKKLRDGQPVNFFNFFLQRGFKIWPSYYVFLIIGTGIAYFLYRNLAPNQIIHLSDSPRYLLFYQNYVGAPYHWIFDHVWSLCVEEHFYIMLPILFILIQRFFNKQRYLFTAVCLVIVACIILKELTMLFTRSQETYSATHNRIDALAWGVLLNLIIFYYPELLKKKYSYLLSLFGAALFAIAIGIDATTQSGQYQKVVFHSIVPFCFFLMIAGLYYFDFSRLKLLRFVSYYSYNWYLWHLLFLIFLKDKIQSYGVRLAAYLAISFLLAMFFTIFIEEPMLKMRKPILRKLFKPPGTTFTKI